MGKKLDLYEQARTKYVEAINEVDEARDELLANERQRQDALELLALGLKHLTEAEETLYELGDKLGYVPPYLRLFRAAKWNESPDRVPTYDPNQWGL